MMCDERMRRTTARMCVSAMCVFALIGCASRDSEMERFGVSPSASPVEAGPLANASPLAGFQSMRIGISVKGRPIDLLIFGELGKPSVLILGAIHGDEPTSANLT